MAGAAGADGTQAVVLVGGQGTRLRPLTDTRPKPMVPLVDRPFVAHQIDHLVRHGVRDLVFSCGYRPDALRDHFGDGSGMGVRIRYVVDPVRLGTAGAVRNAADLLGDGPTLVLNGDILTDLDLGAVLAQHRRTRAEGTVVLTPVEDPSAFGLVRLFDDLAVEAFLEKPAREDLRPGEPFLINAGTYVLERSVIDEIPAGVECSIERETFPEVAARRGLYGHASDAYWLDIGTPAAYLRANRDVLAGRVRTESPVGPRYVGPGTVVAEGADVGEGCAVGAECRIETGASVNESVLGIGVEVGAGARVDGAILGDGVRVGADAVVSAGAVVGDGATVDPGTSVDGPLRAAVAR